MLRWMSVDSGFCRNQLVDTSIARYWIELGGRRTYQNKRQRSVHGYLLLIEVAESDIATTSPEFVTQGLGSDRNVDINVTSEMGVTKPARVIAVESRCGIEASSAEATGSTEESGSSKPIADEGNSNL